MNKTILIQTDFSVNSLNTVKVFFEQYAEKNEKYNLLFVTGYELSNSITDLLFISKTKIIQSAASKEFFEAFNIIKNKFESQLNSSRIDLFIGFGQTAFNEFLKINAIEKIYTSDNLQFSRSLNKNCFSLTKYIRKSGLEFTEVENNSQNEVNYFLQSSMSRVYEGSAQLHS